MFESLEKAGKEIGKDLGRAWESLAEGRRCYGEAHRGEVR